MKKIILFAAAGLMAFTISCNDTTSEKTTTTTTTTSSSDTAMLVKNNAPAAAAPVANVPEGMSLMTKSDCMSCHNATAKVVGPSFADIAAKYPNNADNISRLTAVVISGGSGVWGSVPMPAHPALAKADAEKMVTYILAQK